MAASAALFVLLTAGSACEAAMDIEATAEVFYTVRGTAAGVLEPVSLRLEFTGGSEILSITGDGEFSFKIHLDPGTMYYVMFLKNLPCVLEGERSGMITDIDPEITVTCKGVEHPELTLSGTTVDVTHPSGFERSYLVTIRRTDSKIAQ